jgi:hypothetical protein
VWARTSRIGCGFTAYRSSGGYYTQLYVCNYGEAGNVISQPVYRIGAACASCPGACSAKYRSLCTGQQWHG